MALHSGFFSFLERRETTVGGTVCLDLQSWMCKDVFPGLMYQRQRKNLKGNESSRIKKKKKRTFKSGENCSLSLEL